MDLKDYSSLNRKGRGKSNWRIMKLDESFSEEIRKFAKKNNMNIREASKELANFIKDQSNGKRKRREVIRIIKNVEF